MGIGFDVHRLVPKRKLYIAGLKIKSKIGTLGHSDGDPVLHAITDAILGACKMGDIGQMFSDKSKKFKNISSTILLKRVLNKIDHPNISTLLSTFQDTGTLYYQMDLMKGGEFFNHMKDCTARSTSNIQNFFIF